MSVFSVFSCPSSTPLLLLQCGRTPKQCGAVWPSLARYCSYGQGLFPNCRYFGKPFSEFFTWLHCKPHIIDKNTMNWFLWEVLRTPKVITEKVSLGQGTQSAEELHLFTCTKIVLVSCLTGVAWWNFQIIQCWVCLTGLPKKQLLQHIVGKHTLSGPTRI